MPELAELDNCKGGRPMPAPMPIPPPPANGRERERPAMAQPRVSRTAAAPMASITTMGEMTKPPCAVVAMGRPSTE